MNLVISRLGIYHAITFCATGENERERERERGSYIKPRGKEASANIQAKSQ
jgi:hypothetical protein